ncbi:hypothetical protein PENTCL1PPCAC_22007 [Pristionchus entomophagus]|uniref:C2H2-type domain-containing protein n=1 Tax=Pristionchus entomophagus TaxID=358040 RepID=A0AAV5U054_9BILA|nr:hypothetical protein PENTCL1PPCAC_22007 [Pristionchus entomophagus]
MFTPYATASKNAATLSSLLGSALAPTVPLPAPLPSLQYPGVTEQWNLGLQLYLVMQQQLMQPLQTELQPKEIKEEEKEPKLSPAQTATTASPNAFSIDHLLLDSSSPSQDRTASSSSSDGRSTIEIKDDKPNVYTLDSLDCNDGRSREGEKRSASRCVCDECGKSYATASNLSRHKQTHRPIDSEHAKKCPHCDRVYVSMPALSMHLLTHNAAHECGVCGKTFSRLWLLQGHLRSHTGTRPFGCAHCGKFFSDRSNLRAHILTHTGIKRFGCDGCGKRFVLRSYLNRHVESGGCSSLRATREDTVVPADPTMAPAIGPSNTVLHPIVSSVILPPPTVVTSVTVPSLSVKDLPLSLQTLLNSMT